MTLPFVAFAGVVLFAFSVEATAGFGSMLITITLGAHLLPIDQIVPVAVPLDVVLTAWLVARHREHVAWRLLLRSVLPLMAVGLVAGQLLLNETALRAVAFRTAVL